MILGSPQFLLLIPLLIVLGWFVRRFALWKPVRALLLLLLILALCDPLVRLRNGGIDLWVLLDRSSSAEELVSPNVEEWRSLLERSKPGSRDELRFIDYAAEVVPTVNAETAVFPGNREETKSALAIRSTLARAEPNRHHRILLFTDGFSTEPLTGILDKLLEQDSPRLPTPARGEHGGFSSELAENPGPDSKRGAVPRRNFGDGRPGRHRSFDRVSKWKSDSVEGSRGKERNRKIPLFRSHPPLCRLPIRGNDQP